MSASLARSLRLLRLEIRVEQDVVFCRQRARQLVAALGGDVQTQTRIATAVSEIARNAFQYAGGGHAEFAVETEGEGRLRRQSIIVTVHDTGGGIAKLPAVLSGEYRSETGLGLGIIGARRLMDQVEISSTNSGTRVVMRKILPPSVAVRTPAELQVIVDDLARQRPNGPLEELQAQNRELITALDEVRQRQDDLGHVNDELAATNTGVLALYDELETLHRVSVVVASQLDLSALAESIIEAATELTGAEFGAFYVREDDGRWKMQASAGVAREHLMKLAGESAADFFGPDFSEEGVLRIPELCEHLSPCAALRFRAALASSLVMRSCLTVPIATQREGLRGGLVFGSSTRDQFTERSERIVSSIAAQSIVGLERARLFHTVQAASEAKDQFLAMLSHELRTPLNPVMAIISSLVGDPRLPHEIQEEIAIAFRNLRLGTRLIDDLLDFSRIIKGKLRIAREPIDVHVLIESVIAICTPELEEKAHRLTSNLNAPHAVIAGDSARIQQVLWNVLKNAIKFTPPGGEISLTTELSAADMLRISIADNGPGIELEALPQIFGAFHQGSTLGSAQQGGLGLGLAISKSFVELHGGQISAHSPGAGGGTEIVLLFPTMPHTSHHTAPAQPAAPPAPNGANAGARILLIDDHQDTVRTLTRLLTRKGHVIFSAGSCAAAAAELARVESVDLIISDLGLPDGSGLDLLPRLRTRGNIPAIALSGYGMENDVQNSRAVGFEEHLTKPIDFTVLERAIGRLLRDRPASRD